MIKELGTGHRVCENIKRLNQPITLFYKQERDLDKTRKIAESSLLFDFMEEHHELPAWNRSGPKIV